MYLLLLAIFLAFILLIHIFKVSQNYTMIFVLQKFNSIGKLTWINILK